MTAADGCEWGLWTNGLERFFLRKRTSGDSRSASPRTAIGRMADGSMSTPDMHAGNLRAPRRPRKRPAPRLPALPQFHPRQRRHAQGRRLLAVPLSDLRQDARRAAQRGDDRRFWAAADRAVHRRRPDEDPAADRAAVRGRQEAIPALFRANEEITLSDRALAFMVSELATVRLLAAPTWTPRAPPTRRSSAPTCAATAASTSRPGRGEPAWSDPRPEAQREGARPGLRHGRIPGRHHRPPACAGSRAEYKREPGDKTTAGRILDRLRDYAAEQSLRRRLRPLPGPRQHDEHDDGRQHRRQHLPHGLAGVSARPPAGQRPGQEARSRSARSTC